MTGADGAAGWPPDLLSTLARVFSTFLPEASASAERLARRAAAILDETADPDDLRLLKLAVRSLEIPPLLFASGGGWGRFSALPPAARERVLLRWSTHPLGRLRTAYQALRRLGLFLALADAGEGQLPTNPLWARIGYVPAEHPTPAAPAVSVLDVERSGSGTLELEAEAVVVGSGAGGGVVAARLAAAGLGVLVLEAGPYRPENALPRLEGQGFWDLYLDHGTTATADLGVTILAGAGLGGGTTVNWTTSLEPTHQLRREWSSGHGLRGFDDAQADGDFARLRAELGMRRPTVIPPKDQLILDGTAALGWEGAPTERNAGPCVDCGACSFGCPTGAKRSGLRSHLAAASHDGARLLADAPVDRLDVRDGRLVGVSGTLRGPGTAGRAYRIRSGTVIVAAGALRTPLLLTASGLAHPQLCRNLRLHPVVAVAAFMEQPVDAWRGPTQAARSLEFCAAGPPGRDGLRPAHGGFVIESAPPHPGLFASALPWVGAREALGLITELRHVAPLIGIVRDQGAGRVRLTRRGRPRIDYRLGAADAATARRALVEMAQLARAGGARRIMSVATPPALWALADGDAGFLRFQRALAAQPASPNRISLFSAHQMGTARAGADASAHPCDPDGRVRIDAAGTILRGCYVADASLFPTASGVNPMLTVMALAERTARAVVADRG